MKRPNFSTIPLRIRLTAWFTAALGGILLLFVAFLYWQTERNMIAQTDHALELAAVQAMLNVDADSGRLAFQNLDENRQVLNQLDDDFVIYLLAADGTIWEKLGNTEEPPIYTTLPTGYATRDEHGETWRIISQELTLDGTSGWLQVRQDMEQLEDALKELRQLLQLGMPTALILAGLGGFLLSSRALRPIDKMTRTAQAITAEDLNQRINYQGAKDEIGRLAQTFDGMLNRLQSAFERERRFTSNAAHELRTPLTVLKGSIDVTLSQPRGTAACMETLAVMNEEVERLIRLSNDLLFMARLEQGRYRSFPEPIEMKPFLETLVDQIRPLATAKEIQLQEQIPDNITIDGDIDLLIRLFLNLLDNAIKYTPEQGHVQLVATATDSGLSVAIQDSGPGIAPADLPRLFDRFYRVETDRARPSGQDDQGGAGLGLTIAQEIAQTQGGRITVASQLGHGTTFTVLLPKAAVVTTKNNGTINTTHQAVGQATSH